MNTVILIFAIYAVAFAFKESSGPWGIMSWLRNQLLQNKYVGVFFYNLLSCWFCTGFHAGYVVYLLNTPPVQWALNSLLIWGLAGGTICLFLNALLNKLE